MSEIWQALRSAEGIARGEAHDRIAGLGRELGMRGTVGDIATRDASAAGSLGAAEETPESQVTTPPAAATTRRWFEVEGYGTFDHACNRHLAAQLAETVENLLAANLPAVFVYLFDEPWALGEHLRARASTLFGRPYVLVEDVWAFHVARGRGRGWPPHRGLRTPVLDREAPELLNVWAAMTDASAERSCMHAVPLSEDPHYPGALDADDHLDAPLATVRALPIGAGDALFWNANLLHWGGACSERAAGARVSLTFSLCRADASPVGEAAFDLPRLDVFKLDLQARLDLIARQILTYGAGQPDVSEAALSWANATHALRQAAALFGASPPSRP